MLAILRGNHPNELVRVQGDEFLIILDYLFHDYFFRPPAERETETIRQQTKTLPKRYDLIQLFIEDKDLFNFVRSKYYNQVAKINLKLNSWQFDVEIKTQFLNELNSNLKFNYAGIAWADLFNKQKFKNYLGMVFQRFNQIFTSVFYPHLILKLSEILKLNMDDHIKKQIENDFCDKFLVPSWTKILFSKQNQRNKNGKYNFMNLISLFHDNRGEFKHLFQNYYDIPYNHNTIRQPATCYKQAMQYMKSVQNAVVVMELNFRYKFLSKPQYQTNQKIRDFQILLSNRFAEIEFNKTLDTDYPKFADDLALGYIHIYDINNYKFIYISKKPETVTLKDINRCTAVFNQMINNFFTYTCLADILVNRDISNNEV